MGKSRVFAALVTAALALLAGSARAQPPDDPPPHVPRAPLPAPRARYLPQPPGPARTPLQPAFESRLALQQGLVAGVTPIVAVVVAVNLRTPVGVAVPVVMAPLVSGTLVCLIGNASAYYRAPCAAPLVGAVLGALTTVPLWYLGTTVHVEDDVNLAPLLLGALGWFIIQPVATVTAWHLLRAPRPAATPLPPAVLHRALPPERPRGLSLAPGELTLPVVSHAF
jgi:hypothetical protein